MSNFQIGEEVLLNGKTYKIIGTIKRSFLLERDGKQYKATAKMMGKIQDQNKRGIGVGRKKRTRIDHMAKRLDYMRIFDKNAKLPETEEEHMEWFSKLCSELSPENLMCDGEISMSAARKKASALRAEWKQVEKSLGRKVSEGEAESWWIKKFHEKRNVA